MDIKKLVVAGIVGLFGVGCASSRKAAEAPTSLPQATQADDSQIQSDVEAAEQALKREDWKTARPLCESLTQRRPNEARYWKYLGIAAQSLGDTPAALTAYMRSLAIEDSAQVRFNVGQMLAAAGRVDLALEEFERSVSADPKYSRGWLALSRAHLELGEWPEGLLAMMVARKTGAPDVEVEPLKTELRAGMASQELSLDAVQLYLQAHAARESGDVVKATALFRQATTTAPKFAEAHYNLGVLASAQDDLSTAEASYRAAIAQAIPAQKLIRGDAQNNLAFMLLKQQTRLGEAEQLARNALELRPERASYLDTLAQICDAEGNSACAKDAYRRLLDSGEDLPQNVKAHAEERLNALGRSAP